MVTVEEHKKSIDDLLKDIEEKIKNNLIVERQRLIGFAASEAACDLFAVLLHRKGLVSPGFNVNHRFFASDKKAKEKFNFDIPEKGRLLGLLVAQDAHRSKLCYGRGKEENEVVKAIKNVYEIKSLVESILGEVL